MSNKFSQKILDTAKKSTTEKKLQKEQFNSTAEATGDLIGNKTAN